MQTNFTAAQLEDPDLKEANTILRNCVHCGFCTATCPTYVLLGDERDSPRGRIYLMKDMLERGRPADTQTVRHIDRCLSCLACMTTCPSGVHYMHLVDQSRAHIERTYRRPLAERALRRLLGAVLPYPARFRAALAAAKLGAPFRFALPSQLRPLFALAARRTTASASEKSGVHPAEGTRVRRVALLAGCVQTVLDPAINAATVRLLRRHGCEVVIAADSGCCGALDHHLGRSDAAHALARRNIDAWWHELSRGGLDAVVINASGCGTMVKDYGYLFRTDGAYAEKAARISALARDVTEIVDEIGLRSPAAPEPVRVAYHSACSMQHGQRLHWQPQRLLKQAGFDVQDVPEGHICCGSAGTYNILQPELADRLLARKVLNIQRVKPDIISTGNIGCMVQIARGTAIPVVHTAELLDWATGGPKPLALGVQRPSGLGFPVKDAPP
jgi:glycolate oxidase iron-sulfur subunit